MSTSLSPKALTSPMRSVSASKSASPYSGHFVHASRVTSDLAGRPPRGAGGEHLTRGSDPLVLFGPGSLGAVGARTQPATLAPHEARRPAVQRELDELDARPVLHPVDHHAARAAAVEAFVSTWTLASPSSPSSPCSWPMWSATSLHNPARPPTARDWLEWQPDRRVGASAVGAKGVAENGREPCRGSHGWKVASGRLDVPTNHPDVPLSEFSGRLRERDSLPAEEADRRRHIRGAVSG
jgi:hypothetical protein